MMTEYTKALMAYLDARREYDAHEDSMPDYRSEFVARMDKAEAELMAICGDEPGTRARGNHEQAESPDDRVLCPTCGRRRVPELSIVAPAADPSTLDLEPIRVIARRWCHWIDVRTSIDFAVRDLARGALALIKEVEQLRAELDADHGKHSHV